MAKAKYKVELSPKERDELIRLIAEGKESERTLMRARILLLSDYSTETKVMSNDKLADLLGTTHTTVQAVRTGYVMGGLEKAIFRKKVEHRARKIDDEVISRIIALTEEKPPEGRKRWSLRSLCRECEQRGYVSHIAASTMIKVMEENNIKLRR